MFFPEMLEAYIELPGAETAPGSNAPIAPVQPTRLPPAEAITKSAQAVPPSPVEAVAALKVPPDTDDGGDSPVGGSASTPSLDESSG
jgi:hypothetical protein